MLTLSMNNAIYYENIKENVISHLLLEMATATNYPEMMLWETKSAA